MVEQYDGLNVTLMVRELQSARRKFPGFASAHEGYAVLLEEVLELQAEVFKKNKSRENMKNEALQIAAMAIRFASDICE
jgi:hypothetical protein